MGWKSKLLFLFIVYFAGFATAIYYLAPPDENNLREYTQGNYQENSEGESPTMSALNSKYNKITASLSGMSRQDFKDAYNRGVQAVARMVEKSQNTSAKAE